MPFPSSAQEKTGSRGGPSITRENHTDLAPFPPRKRPLPGNCPSVSIRRRARRQAGTFLLFPHADARLPLRLGIHEAGETPRVTDGTLSRVPATAPFQIRVHFLRCVTAGHGPSFLSNPERRPSGLGKRLLRWRVRGVQVVTAMAPDPGGPTPARHWDSLVSDKPESAIGARGSFRLLPCGFPMRARFGRMPRAGPFPTPPDALARDAGLLLTELRTERMPL